jgi:glycine C-acetyltransferase
VLLEGRRYLMASSYDYLSLIGHPHIDDAAIDAVRRNGTGTGGVRLLTGTIPDHRRLERCIAERYGTEDCVTFSSGYFANIAAMAAFGGRSVTAFVDSLSHRSVIDACTLARSPLVRFRHNDPADAARLAAGRGGASGVVFVESLYSMDGDRAPLFEMAGVARAAGLPLLIDDAHGLGVLDHPTEGPGEVVPAAWVGALSKAVPSNGGFVAMSREAADRIRHLAAPYIFSAAAAPAAVAAARAAFEVMRDEPWRQAALRANIECFARLLFGEAHGHDLHSPIFPIYFREDEQTLLAAAALKSAGIIATPIVSPAVGANQPRLRICINAAHSSEDLERLARAIRDLHPLPELEGTAPRS